MRTRLADLWTAPKKKPLGFDYRPIKHAVAHFNGHTVEIDWTPDAKTHNNSIAIGSTQYNLIQFHFHTPSEHRINGRHAGVVLDAELLLVHRSSADNSLAVISVMLQVESYNVHFFSCRTKLQKKFQDHKNAARLEAAPATPVATPAKRANASAAPASTGSCRAEAADTICAGNPPADEEANHVDLPLKPVDFSALVKTLGGLLLAGSTLAP
ncbi:hypothetical protein BGX23_010125 [Mortierella sp. AD031]|nr:hypothetical protein BGX23_010125 [Mortierella sp. AD031]